MLFCISVDCYDAIFRFPFTDEGRPLVVVMKDMPISYRYITTSLTNTLRKCLAVNISTPSNYASRLVMCIGPSIPNMRYNR